MSKDILKIEEDENESDSDEWGHIYIKDEGANKEPKPVEPQKTVTNSNIYGYDNIDKEYDLMMKELENVVPKDNVKKVEMVYK